MTFQAKLVILKHNVDAQFFLGVDGGGTHCRVRLESLDGQTIAEGIGGPANVRLGQAYAWSSIMSAVDAALQTAGLGRDILKSTAAGLGLAGILRSKDCEDLDAHAGMFSSLHISSDCHAACLGAFDGRDGGIVIAGTGSSGYVILGGVGYQRGGWGFRLAEKASGAALGRDAIRAALEASDGLLAASPFTEVVMARFGTPVDVVDWSENAGPKDYADIAPLVFDFAARGDPNAISLVRQLADDCGRYILDLTRLGAPRVSLLGGLSAQLMNWLTPSIVSELVAPEGDALAGALLLARQPYLADTTKKAAGQ
jgi:glucosamine kinase